MIGYEPSLSTSQHSYFEHNSLSKKEKRKRIINSVHDYFDPYNCLLKKKNYIVVEISHCDNTSVNLAFSILRLTNSTRTYKTLLGCI